MEIGTAASDDLPGPCHRSFRRAARDASVRSEVARIVAQKSRALSAPLRLRLYTHISRTSDLPGGTSLRSMSSQLPLSVWLAISARSAAVQPARSSRKACLRVFGSVLDEVARRTQPVLRAYMVG
eukprot:2004856-Pleurochrysis_carterae.AAC.5